MLEKKILIKNVGIVDPGNLETYLAQGGFDALGKAKKMGSENVISEVKSSGLRGRGGAGFPCGAKWEMTAKSAEDTKYVICNADEGEIGAFKDRYLLKNDPFGVIEGLAITAYAIGATKAYIYLRSEYRYLLNLLNNAISQAQDKIGDLEIEIREGAGAYICGEESALMNSIEGRRGEPRYRPPFPPTSGLFGKPTIINNVETLMNIPLIIKNGAKWFSEMGTEKSKGTKLFSISGDVERPGVYELELGCKLSDLLEIAIAKDTKFVQIGGSTGGIIPSSMIETPLAYETVLGSGAVIVLNKNRDIIDFIHKTMKFLNEESCGFCTPCREGTEVMVEIYKRLVKGEGNSQDIEVLEDLSNVMMLSSMCGLGQMVPIPVLDTLKYFRNEYENRIKKSIFLRQLGTYAK